MSKSRSYELNCTDYVFHEDGVPTGALLSEVAVAFSRDAEDDIWTLFKHGSPKSVHAWVEKQKKSQGQHPGIADDIHVIEGKLPISDLNNSLENNQKIKILIKNCFSIFLSNDAQNEYKSIKMDGIPISEKNRDTEKIIASFFKDAGKKTDAEIEDAVIKHVKIKP